MLPSPCTEESHMRLRLSQRLCRACPIPLGREIAVTGSVARGTTDAASDLELNVWVDDLPSADVRRDWLLSIGGTDIVLNREETGDGTMWSHARLQGVLVEIGWQPLAAVPQEVDALLRGEVTDHRALVKASVIQHAVPLRSRGAIEQWKYRLARYPDAVASALIADACDAWRFLHILDSPAVLRVSAELQREGVVVNRKAVQRHMREMGIAGVCPRPNLSRRRHEHKVHVNGHFRTSTLGHQEPAWELEADEAAFRWGKRPSAMSDGGSVGTRGDAASRTTPAPAGMVRGGGDHRGWQRTQKRSCQRACWQPCWT